MRTLHLTNAWHPTSGGVRTFYQALLEAAARDRRHMAVVVPGDRTTVTHIGPTARLYTVEAPSSPVFDRRYRVLLPHRYLRVRRSVLWRILACEHPDLIEISDKYSLCHLAGLIKGRAHGRPRPTLVGLSQERMDDNVRAWVSASRTVDSLVRAYLATVYLPQFDAHLANSEYTADELRAVVEAARPAQWRLRRLRDRIRVLPMGVDVADFGPEQRDVAARRRLIARAGGGGDSALLLYAGRLSPEKQVLALPDAMRSLLARGHDVVLVVAGEGPARARLERALASAAPGRHALVGHLGDRGALASLLASADVFVHPNPREPFGIGPLEAMASGTPVVLPGAGGVLSYADEATAWLAEPGADGLARAIGDCLRSPVIARARAAAARRRVADFRWPVVAGRYFETYEDLHRLRTIEQARSVAGVGPVTTRDRRDESSERGA